MFSFLVFPPGNYLSPGKIFVMARLDGANFFDTPAAICHRQAPSAGQACLLRFYALSPGDSQVYLQLPYIKPFYDWVRRPKE